MLIGKISRKPQLIDRIHTTTANQSFLTSYVIQTLAGVASNGYGENCLRDASF